MTVWPICIPSKGRPDRTRKGNTMKLCEEANLPYTLFVEPQEVDAYRENWPTAEVVDIQDSDRGVSYVRNQILRHANNEFDSPWFWMIDDDMTRFTLFNPVTNKLERTRLDRFFRTLQGAYRRHGADRLPYAMLGMPYEQFAWSGPEWKSTSHVHAAVAFNTQVAGVVQYDEDLPLLEDLDMTLKLWFMGYRTGAMSFHGWNSPAMGGNPGGLMETWAQQDLFMDCARRVSDRYPMFYRPCIDKYGKPAYRLNMANAKKLIQGRL